MLCEFFNEELEYQENLLVRYYAKQGHEVVVVTSVFESAFDFGEDRLDPRLEARSYDTDGAHVIRLGYRYNLFNRLRPFTSISGILEERRPDLVFVHDVALNFPEVVAYKRRHPRVRVIMDYHADASNSGRNWLSRRVLHGMIRRRVLDRARPHLSRIFPVVPASAAFLHEIYGVPHEEMELLPLGADADLGEEVRRGGEGEALRRAMGIAADEVVLVTGGKLTPAKRTELAIAAVQRLPDLPLRLIVLGDASRRDRDYREKLEAAAGADRVVFVGWQDRVGVYRHLDMADLAVFPGSQSVLWQQAIGMGLPLVVGDVGGQDVSYLNLHDNIVVLDRERLDARHLARAIAEIAGDESLRSRMASGARRVADECLDWNKLIEKTLRFNCEGSAAAAGAG